MIKRTIIFIAIILAFGLIYWHSLSSPANKNGQEKKFTVAKGEATSRIASNLEKADLIKSSFYFKYVIWSKKFKIKAGEYLLSPADNIGEIVKKLSSGESLNNEKQIRIIEGWGIKDINDYLNKNNLVAGDSFINLASKKIGELKFLELDSDLTYSLPATANLEGWLFPDTYRIMDEANAEYIINKMVNNLSLKLNKEMRREIKGQSKSVYEVLTMASLIEKEVRTQDDMKIVGGIFWDRIKYGMPLQSDASLSYILNDKIGGHTLEQLKIDSPYNTYRYQGLPPGPISNPGLNAIKAAIYPTSTEYVYFLSDPETGKTIFSKTLAEHNKNKAKYLK